MNAPFVLAAGGTGGHLFPAQALAGELMRRGRRVVVMTDGRGLNYGTAFPGAEIAILLESMNPAKIAIPSPIESQRWTPARKMVLPMKPAITPSAQ